MSPTFRKLLMWSRWTHVYLTLFGLALILFFAITGFMLNHEDWFLPSEPRVRTVEGALPTKLLQPVDKLAVAESLRRDFGVAGLVNSFLTNDESVEVEFLRPGERAVAEVARETGKLSLRFESKGFAGAMTDLHKGKSSGPWWSWVIDGVCVLLLVISCTGLVLWWSLKSRAKWGALVLLAGAGGAFAAYCWLVP